MTVRWVISFLCRQRSSLVQDVAPVFGDLAKPPGHFFGAKKKYRDKKTALLHFLSLPLFGNGLTGTVRECGLALGAYCISYLELASSA